VARIGDPRHRYLSRILWGPEILCLVRQLIGAETGAYLSTFHTPNIHSDGMRWSRDAVFFQSAVLEGAGHFSTPGATRFL
jgi:hypothetical protein